MSADHYVHYTQSTKANEIKTICGKPWERITDIPAKVNCPDCLKEMEKKPNGNI